MMGTRIHTGAVEGGMLLDDYLTAVPSANADEKTADPKVDFAATLQGLIASGQPTASPSNARTKAVADSLSDEEREGNSSPNKALPVSSTSNRSPVRAWIAFLSSTTAKPSANVAGGRTGNTESVGAHQLTKFADASRKEINGVAPTLADAPDENRSSPAMGKPVEMSAHAASARVSSHSPMNPSRTLVRDSLSPQPVTQPVGRETRNIPVAEEMLSAESSAAALSLARLAEPVTTLAESWASSFEPVTDRAKGNIVYSSGKVSQPEPNHPSVFSPVDSNRSTISADPLVAEPVISSASPRRQPSASPIPNSSSRNSLSLPGRVSIFQNLLPLDAGSPSTESKARNGFESSTLELNVANSTSPHPTRTIGIDSRQPHAPGSGLAPESGLPHESGYRSWVLSTEVNSGTLRRTTLPVSEPIETAEQTAVAPVAIGSGSLEISGRTVAASSIADPEFVLASRPATTGLRDGSQKSQSLRFNSPGVKPSAGNSTPFHSRPERLGQVAVAEGRGDLVRVSDAAEPGVIEPSHAIAFKRPEAIETDGHEVGNFRSNRDGVVNWSLAPVTSHGAKHVDPAVSQHIDPILPVRGYQLTQGFDPQNHLSATPSLVSSNRPDSRQVSETPISAGGTKVSIWDRLSVTRPTKLRLSASSPTVPFQKSSEPISAPLVTGADANANVSQEWGNLSDSDLILPQFESSSLPVSTHLTTPPESRTEEHQVLSNSPFDPKFYHTVSVTNRYAINQHSSESETYLTSKWEAQEVPESAKLPDSFQPSVVSINRFDVSSSSPEPDNSFSDSTFIDPVVSHIGLSEEAEITEANSLQPQVGSTQAYASGAVKGLDSQSNPLR